MKTTLITARSLLVLGLAASSSLVGMQPAIANPDVSVPSTANTAQNSSARQLGESMEIRGIGSALNRPEQEMPTFEVQNKSPRKSGILSVLGGRFVLEDRHPSFRKSTIQR